ncbi:histidine phosphatase family protein [Nocardioides sp. J2M5]|uniref:histidine phosphatase family protein n=1 Tax=Nocardioides palaemonis TaxID=2829810 RepID=UPI001BA99228|nr:histidine phosphatase family protein [Nocardioides palaemonis]MBS2938740.1 histidine phosphatase family protein [Nocardioides palaemonis]
MSEAPAPARLIVARHGEAAYESELLSDAGGWLTTLGREQARRLGEDLLPAGVTRVWCSPMARAEQTAEIAAAVLGVDVVVREGLREFGVGVHAGAAAEPDPFRPTFMAWLHGDLDARIEGAESGNEVVARVGSVLDEVAAAHAGGAALVVSHGGSICLAVPVLARNLAPFHAGDLPLRNCEVVDLVADRAGLLARAWAGARV